ncbi:MAG: family 16 glycoside hydrolase [Pseudomonadota bacterium]
MLASVGDAIDALAGEISGLLSTPANASLTPQISVHPNKSGTVGIGGFIDLHDDPQAEIWGRRLDAEVIVRVLAADQAGLLAAETQATRDILAADPDFLRKRGLLRVRRQKGDKSDTLAASDGLSAPFGRDIRFDVMFEHKPLPSQSEGTIDEVRRDITQGGDGPGKLVYATEFLDDPLADFSVANSGGQGTAGAWAYDAPNDQLLQTGTRRSGVAGLSGNKGGTFLTLNTGVAGGPLMNFVLNADVRSDGGGGLGLVFRFTDPQNFAFALLQTSSPLRVMGKRVANSGDFLETGGQADGVGYPTGEWLRLRLLADGDRFELAINEVTVLSGTDSTLTTPGNVGFFCRSNGTARFRHFRLARL